MRRGSAFSHLLLVFAAVIFLCVSLLMGTFYVTMRDVQIKNRENALKSQAYDIARIAGSLQARSLDSIFGMNNAVAQELLRYKLRSVYEEYSAYCLMVDRSGKGTAYFLSVLENDEDLQAAFDTKSITGTLTMVLNGQEVVTQSSSPKGPMFTIAVPWIEGGRAQGAVYIQTAAQTIRASYDGLITSVAASALLAVVAATLIAVVYSRRLTNPLRDMARAAQALSTGEFTHRVSIKGTAEMQELAIAFNSMGAQLKDTEQKRRDFIANLSHELRSPMTSITGFIQGVLDGTIPPQEGAHYLQLSLDEARRLTKLINSLLHMSHMENEAFTLHFTHFEINELIRRVLITAMGHMEEKKLEVSLNFDTDSIMVHADRDQIEQVLINLIENAVKFTPADGRIDISTHYRDARIVEVKVQDNGMGILPQDEAHVFDRFYKADKAHSVGMGTGLGLAISKMIIEKHGQQIMLVPSRQGACFLFTLEALSGKESNSVAN